MTEKGIRKRYYNTFELVACGAILKTKKYWELEEHIPIPEYMQKGSLKQAVELMNFNSHYDFLMTKRAYNVDNHIRTHVNEEYGLKKGKTVRDIHGHIWFWSYLNDEGWIFVWWRLDICLLKIKENEVQMKKKSKKNEKDRGFFIY